MYYTLYFYSKKKARENEKRSENPKFRLGMRTSFRGHVTSGSPIGHEQWHILYHSNAKCTSCARARDHFRDFWSGPLTLLPVAHAHAITPGSSTTSPHHKCDLSCAHILLVLFTSTDKRYIYIYIYIFVVLILLDVYNFISQINRVKHYH